MRKIHPSMDGWKKSKEEAMVARLEAHQPSPSGAGKEILLGKTKAVKKVVVKQELVDLILMEPFEPLGGDDDEVLMGMSEPYRDCHAKARAALEALAEFDADIIKQYQAKGYAEVDMLVIDDDDKS